MGGLAPANRQRRVRASIIVRDRIDLVEVVRNGEVVWSGPEPARRRCPGWSSTVWSV